MSEQENKIADKAAEVVTMINDYLKETGHNQKLWLRFRALITRALLMIGKEQPRIPRVQVGEDIFQPQELRRADPNSVHSSDILAYSKDGKDPIQKSGRKGKNDGI